MAVFDFVERLLKAQLNSKSNVLSVFRAVARTAVQKS
jgi:hypothetical protein